MTHEPHIVPSRLDLERMEADAALARALELLHKRDPEWEGTMDDQRYCGQCRQWEQEVERLREAGCGYSQETMDAVIAERERLRAQLARVAAWAYCKSCYKHGWQPYFELDSKVDEILRPYLDQAEGGGRGR